MPRSSPPTCVNDMQRFTGCSASRQIIQPQSYREAYHRRTFVTECPPELRVSRCIATCCITFPSSDMRSKRNTSSITGCGICSLFLSCFLLVATRSIDVAFTKLYAFAPNLLDDVLGRKIYFPFQSAQVIPFPEVKSFHVADFRTNLPNHWILIAKFSGSSKHRGA